MGVVRPELCGCFRHLWTPTFKSLIQGPPKYRASPVYSGPQDWGRQMQLRTKTILSLNLKPTDTASMVFDAAGADFEGCLQNVTLSCSIVFSGGLVL